MAVLRNHPGALLTLMVILHSAMSLDHPLPNLSMPPAYKEEKTRSALSRSLHTNTAIYRPACRLKWSRASAQAVGNEIQHRTGLGAHALAQGNHRVHGRAVDIG